MLRRALLIVAVCVTLAGVLACVTRIWPIGVYLLGWGLVATLALLFERWRYVSTSGRAAGIWQSTGERFEDPESGAIMEVQYQSATGARRYVAASGAREPEVP